MTNLIKDPQKNFCWLTNNMVNSAYTRYKMKRRRLEENSGKEQPTMLQIRIDDEKNSSLHTSMSDLTTEIVDSNSSNNDSNSGAIVTSSVQSVENRDKGGRPVGTTQFQKHRRDDMIVTMKNEIAQQYEEELASHKKKERD